MGRIYPVYTTVENKPNTICQEYDEAVFNSPFFNDDLSLTRINSDKEYNLHSVKISEEDERLELRGLIFHTSHCGSTLLSRMLSQLKRVIVVNEPEAINGLLLSKVLFAIKDDEIINQLKRIIKLYQQETSSKKYLIIKLTSWNVYMISLFQQAFPGLKWIYLDRETEILTKSLAKADGGFINWWNHPVDVLRRHFIEERMEIKNKEEYLIEMIKGHRMHANNHKDSNGLFLKYPGFMETYEEILSHFKLEATTKEIKDSNEMLKYDSKSTKKEVWEKRK